MNNQKDNGLNFDFDSPIENFAPVDNGNDDGEAFDLAAYAASVERKNSRIKRNRINDEIMRDKSIEREQEIFSINREKHAAKNAASRTAPHAITADELLHGKKLGRRVNIAENLSESESETAEKENFVHKNEISRESSSNQETGYSDAAQLVFEKMRNLRVNDSKNEETSDELFITSNLEPRDDNVNETKFFFDENKIESVNSKNQKPEKLIDELPDLFADVDEPYNNDLFSDSQLDEIEETISSDEANSKENYDDVADLSSQEENDFFYGEQADEKVNDMLGEIIPESDGDEENYSFDEQDAIPIQELYGLDSDSETDTSDGESDFIDTNLKAGSDYTELFDAETDGQLSFEKSDLSDGADFESKDGFVNDFTADLPVLDGFDDFFNDNETASDKNTQQLDNIAESSEDTGFDLPEDGDSFNARFTDEIPDPFDNLFDGLDDELFNNITPNKKEKSVNQSFYNEYEYHNFDDEYNVRTFLNNRKKMCVAKLVVSFAATLLSICFTYGLFFVSPDFFGSAAFWISVALINICVLAINFDSVKSVAYAFDGEIESGLLPALASFASLVQAILGIFSLSVADGNFVFTIITSAVFGVTALGEFIRICDTIKNFYKICNEDEKGILSFVDQPDSNRIMDGEDGVGYRIAFRKKAVDIQNFIECTYSSGIYENYTSKVTSVSVLCSIVFAVIYAIVGKSIGYAVVGFCGGLCIASPVSALLMTVISVRRVNAVLKNYNAVLPGFLSGSNIDNTNVVCVDANELFSGDNVKMYNIKTFGGLSLDKAIIDASALLTAADSPLKDMFNDISYGETLPETDSIAYEDKMGLSGWVGGRKTLIGNRMIMETHGIHVPPIDIDKKIIMNGYFPVYLASEGKLSALFIVGYNADAAISYYLKQIFNVGLTLLVRTCDPNITEEMVAEYFGIHRDSVKVMSHEAEIIFDKAVTTDTAALLCNDTKGYLNGIISSIKLIKYSKYSSVAQMIIIALGYMIFGIAASLGSLSLLGCASLLIYNFISLLIIYFFHVKYV